MKFFTLIEVIVALTILTLSLVVLLQLLTSSQLRMVKAEEKWLETHMLMQAAEYYLLSESSDPSAPSSEVFPYSNYSTQCTFEDPENLPEEFTSIANQVPLRACHIKIIRSSDQKVVNSIIVDQFDYENATGVDGEN